MFRITLYNRLITMQAEKLKCGGKRESNTLLRKLTGNGQG